MNYCVLLIFQLAHRRVLSSASLYSRARASFQPSPSPLWSAGARGRPFSDAGTARAEDSALASAYIVLGVQPTASDSELKAAFVHQAKLHHPDAGRGGGGDVRKFIEARNAYALAARHRKLTNGDDSVVDAATDEALGRFDIRHTAPQHRQYLEYEGLGSGTPAERQHQRQQWRVYQAADNVREFRIARLQHEAAAASGTAVATAAPSLKSSERRSANNFRTRSMIDRLVEDLIQESVSRGELQNCRYYGKPLPDRSTLADADPFADSMTHKLNSILANNGYEPDWLLLDKSIRTATTELRHRLVDARSRLGRWPFNQADEAAWIAVLAGCAKSVADLNRQVDQLNLTVPTLQQQRCHYRLVSFAKTVAEDNSLADTWQPPATPRLEFSSDIGNGDGELFSIATLRLAWANLKGALFGGTA